MVEITLYHVLVYVNGIILLEESEYVIAPSIAIAESKVKKYNYLDSKYPNGYTLTTYSFGIDWERDGSGKITKHEILI